MLGVRFNVIQLGCNIEVSLCSLASLVSASEASLMIYNSLFTSNEVHFGIIVDAEKRKFANNRGRDVTSRLCRRLGLVQGQKEAALKSI